MANKIHAVQMEAMEWSYQSGKSYEDPFNEVELDVLVSSEAGEELRALLVFIGIVLGKVLDRPSQ